MPDQLEQLGEVLAGRYTIERVLGRGGMATIYLAQDTKLHRRAAVKVLGTEVRTTVTSERFLREIEIASRLSHPNILALHDAGEADGRLFYVMPYLEGRSLRQRLEEEQQLSVEETLRILRGVAAAVAHAHRAGIVHRDLKPENILLAQDAAGGPPQPLVVDFGIARALDAAGGARLTEAGLALGTAAYMSPEQASAGARLDGRSDIYALGCVAYEMLAGAPPFTGPTAQAVMARHAVDPVPPLRTVRATVPEPVARAIERALAKVPSDRFATAAEFADALGAESPSVRTARLAIPGLGLAFAAALAVAAATTAAVTWRRSAAPALVPSAATIAVMPPISPSADTALTRLGRDLAVTISASLNGVAGITTTDRISLASATAHRSRLSVAQAAEVAQSLGARSTLHGTVLGEGRVVRLDLGLYDVGTLAPLAQNISVRGPRDSLGALTDSVVWSLLRQVWQRGEPPSPSLAAVTTRSIPALRAFLEGERLTELDRWDEAGLAYRTAIAADSTFWLAQLRHQETLFWNHQEVDVELLDRLHLRRAVFPEPDRLLLDAWARSRRNSPPLQFELYRDATRRFPQYWPGWFALGDRLTHVGPMLGYGWAEAQRALSRAVELNPRLRPAWLHMFGNIVGKDTVESARALRGAQAAEVLVPVSSGPPDEHAARLKRMNRLMDRVGRAGGRIPTQAGALADSVAQDYLAAAETGQQWPTWGMLWVGFPAAQIDLNRRVLRLGARPRLAAELLQGCAWGFAERGAWDSALVTMREAVRIEPDPLSESGPTALDEYGMAVLGAWLGAVSPSDAVGRNSAVRRMVGALRGGKRKTELLVTLAWLDGILGFVRRDRDAMEQAREEALRSGHARQDMISRSLLAFERALTGDLVSGGHELAALEWQCADEWDCPIHLANIAVQRLAAATWLLETGDTLQASRLLVWHEAMQPGWVWSFSYAATPLAYLMLARIEEAQGDSRAAKGHYQQFLRRYDLPMPEQRHLVEEAKAALARIAGDD